MEYQYVAKAASFGAGCSGHLKPIVTVTPQHILELMEHPQVEVPELAGLAEAAVVKVWDGGGCATMQEYIRAALAHIAWDADTMFQQAIKEAPE